MSYGDNTSTARTAGPWTTRQPSRSSARPSRPASPSGTPRTCTRTATSEELVGRAIKRYSRREDIVLPRRCSDKMHDGPGGQGLSRKAIIEQADASLTRLGTDYIDLYQIHRFDPDTPAEETMEALHDIIKAGKARYLGASSMYAWQFAKLQHAATLGRLDPVRGHAEPVQPAPAPGRARNCCPCAPTWAWASCPTPRKARDASRVHGDSSPTLHRGRDRQVLRLTPRRASRQRRPASRRNPPHQHGPGRAWRGCSATPSSPLRSSERPNRITDRGRRSASTCTSLTTRSTHSRSRTRPRPSWF